DRDAEVRHPGHSLLLRQRLPLPGAVSGDAMKVPLSWLRDYVEVDLPPKELAHRLTMAGTEAESVEEIGAEWQRIVVARVIDLEPHPGSDRGLWIAKVDRGDGESTIVTGA